MKTSDMLRRIPTLGELLDSPQIKGLVERVNRSVVVGSARTVLEDLRRELARRAREIPSPSELGDILARRIVHGERPLLRPVVNATGVLLSHEMGGAPLADEARESLLAVAGDYASVGIDLASGGPASPAQHVEALLEELTGAEGALVVSSYPGAILLTLAALAPGREVLIARGELEETDEFRWNELALSAGSLLREVGATNIVRIDDYSAQRPEQAGVLLRVQSSAFRILGNAGRPSLAELAAQARRQRMPLMVDAGHAGLLDVARHGWADQQTVQELLRAGADLVLFRGDGLLGGPACGLAVGRSDLVRKISGHPLASSLHVDKLTLAPLAATLPLHRDPEQALLRIPVLSLLATSLENLRQRAVRLAPQIAAWEGGIRQVEVVEEESRPAHLALVEPGLKTCTLAITPREGSAEAFCQALRLGTPAVVGRVEEGRVKLDLRSVFPRQDIQLVTAVEALADHKPPT